jgi:hypothetical protein
MNAIAAENGHPRISPLKRAQFLFWCPTINPKALLSKLLMLLFLKIQIGRMKDLPQNSKSKLTVYADTSVQVIPQPVVVAAKRNVNKKRKVEAEEPLYLNRM